MLTIGFRICILAGALALAACTSGTPECGSSQVNADLQEIAEERLTQAISHELSIPVDKQEEMAEAIRARLTYTFSSIRTTDRDEGTDSYSCSTNLVVNVEGADRNWEGELSYEVYSVEDADSSYEVRYDPAGLGPLAFGALAAKGRINIEADNVVNGPILQNSLQEVRNAGRAGTQREREILESLTQRGLEAPAVTDEQKQLALAEMLKYEYPDLEYSNVPQEILDQAKVRREQAEQEQLAKDQEEEDAKRKRCAEDPYCGL